MFVVTTLTFKVRGLFHRETGPKGADGMANRVDPDQTAPLSPLAAV